MTASLHSVGAPAEPGLPKPTPTGGDVLTGWTTAKPLGLLFVLVLSPGCVSHLAGSDRDLTGFERQCTSTRAAASRPPSPSPPAQQHEADAPLLAGLPVELRRVAEAIGLTSLLTQLHRLQSGHRADDNRGAVKILRTYQLIHARLMLATAEVSTTAGMVRCEQARAEELADTLGKAETTRTNRLTLISVILGGITDAVTGGLGMVGL